MKETLCYCLYTEWLQYITPVGSANCTIPQKLGILSMFLDNKGSNIFLKELTNSPILSGDLNTGPRNKPSGFIPKSGL